MLSSSTWSQGIIFFSFVWSLQARLVEFDTKTDESVPTLFSQQPQQQRLQHTDMCVCAVLCVWTFQLPSDERKKSKPKPKTFTFFSVQFFFLLLLQIRPGGPHMSSAWMCARVCVPSASNACVCGKAQTEPYELLRIITPRPFVHCVRMPSEKKEREDDYYNKCT